MKAKYQKPTLTPKPLPRIGEPGGLELALALRRKYLLSLRSD